MYYEPSNGMPGDQRKKIRGNEPIPDMTSTSGEVPLAPFVVLDKKGKKEDGTVKRIEQEA